MRKKADFAFAPLDRVSLRSHRYTFIQWWVFFDIRNDCIYYQTRDNPIRREKVMGWFDFSCTDAIKIRNINTHGAGNADRFMDYSHDRNRVRVDPLFERHPLTPKDYETRVDPISRYPDSFICR